MPVNMFFKYSSSRGPRINLSILRPACAAHVSDDSGWLEAVVASALTLESAVPMRAEKRGCCGLWSVFIVFMWEEHRDSRYFAFALAFFCSSNSKERFEAVHQVSS